MASFLEDAVGLWQIPSKQWDSIAVQLQSMKLPYTHNDTELTHIIYKGKQYQAYAIWVYIAIILRIVKPSEITPQGYIAKAILEACETPEVKAIMLQNALGLDV